MLSRTFDVTLSFCGNDRSSAYDLAYELSRLGLTVFYDERFQSGNPEAAGDNTAPDLDLTSTVFVPLISKAYVTSVGRNQELQAALDDPQWKNGGRVLPVALGEDHTPGDLAKRIEIQVGSTAGKSPPAEAAVREDPGQHVLAFFAPTPPHKSVEVARYGVVHLMKQCAEAPVPAVRLRGAIEVAKSLFADHNFRTGWPYDIWRRDDSIFLSALPNFSSAHRTLEFVLNAEGSRARLRAVWTPSDERYGKIDYHIWQPSVATLTADRVVPCLEREVTLRLLEQAGTEFGFPVTAGEREPKRLCGWIEQLPPYDFMEWGRDPRLVSGRLGPGQYLLHTPSGIAVYSLLLVGRWSAAAFRTLSEALTVNLPNRHRIDVLGQGRVRLAVFLGDARGQDRGRAFLAHRRVFAAVARMYAALRELPVPPPDGSVALPRLDDRTTSRFDRVCEDFGEGDTIALTSTAGPGNETAPFNKLGETPEGHSLGFASEPGLDLDSLVTHRDIVRFVQRHE